MPPRSSLRTQISFRVFRVFRGWVLLPDLVDLRVSYKEEPRNTRNTLNKSEIPSSDL